MKYRTRFDMDHDQWIVYEVTMPELVVSAFCYEKNAQEMATRCNNRQPRTSYNGPESQFTREYFGPRNS